MADLFICFDPLAGIRHVQVTRRKTSPDFASLPRQVSDAWHSHADRVVLVCDNLFTHTPVALYGAFAPADANQLAQRFERHYTPKHACRTPGN